MNKIILVHYVYVGHLPGHEVGDLLEQLKNQCAHLNSDDIISYWIPIATGNTRVVCINPKLVSKKEFIKAERILTQQQETLKNILSEWKNKTDQK
jgi:hypothetical protein